MIVDLPAPGVAEMAVDDSAEVESSIPKIESSTLEI